MTDPVNLVVDCDAGVDDLFAVAVAALHPRSRLLAVSVVAGNVPMREGVHYVRTILGLSGKAEVPVLAGPEGAQGGDAADKPHGDAAATATLPTLRDIIVAATGRTVVVATGSLTNVAALLRAFPHLVDAIAEVVFLGGAFHYPGNSSPLAERNVFTDPEAAREVFESGLPVTLVPINVSGTFTIPPEVESCLRKGEHLLHDYLWAILAPLRSYYQVVFGAAECPIHDPLAVLPPLAPLLFRRMRAEVSIELSGELTRGVTVVDLRPEAELSNQDSRIQIVETVDAAGAWQEIARALDAVPVNLGG